MKTLAQRSYHGISFGMHFGVLSGISGELRAAWSKLWRALASTPGLPSWEYPALFKRLSVRSTRMTKQLCRKENSVKKGGHLGLSNEDERARRTQGTHPALTGHSPSLARCECVLERHGVGEGEK